MVYVDDGIFLGSNNLQLQEVIKEIQNLGLNIEDQGHPADYVLFLENKGTNSPSIFLPERRM